MEILGTVKEITVNTEKDFNIYVLSTNNIEIKSSVDLAQITIFSAKEVEGQKEEIQKDSNLTVEKGEDSIEIDNSGVYFLTKRNMNTAGDKQIPATASEVEAKFDGGLALDVKIVDGEVDLGSTSMTLGLWTEIKSKKGADPAIPYKITVLNSKKERLGKINFTKIGEDETIAVSFEKSKIK